MFCATSYLVWQGDKKKGRLYGSQYSTINAALVKGGRLSALVFRSFGAWAKPCLARL